MDFRGKSVVITGASSGIGRELAIELARRGANLTLAARGAEQLEEAVRACEAVGGKAVAVRADVSEEADCARVAAVAVEAFGGIDVLVNNAGVSMYGRFDEMKDLTVVERLMRINYFGAVACTFHALPHLKARGGLIVAVSSVTGKTGVPTRTAYAASKHAMQGFFDSLRLELAGTGVDVLVVSPYYIATDIRSRALGSDGRPLGASPRDESTDTVPLDECVRRIVLAMERRERDVVIPARIALGLKLKVVAPGVVDRMTLKKTAARNARK
jgi:NAD(P)-dependent dehydrogenase (short-subunit alcohol dehydrogenase family)